MQHHLWHKTSTDTRTQWGERGHGAQLLKFWILMTKEQRGGGGGSETIIIACLMWTHCYSNWKIINPGTTNPVLKGQSVIRRSTWLFFLASCHWWPTLRRFLHLEEYRVWKKKQRSAAILSLDWQISQCGHLPTTLCFHSQTRTPMFPYWKFLSLANQKW